MKKIRLYIATSIDGYIAGIDGALDWLMKYPIDSNTNYGYDDFYESVDIIIMGGQTYRDILSMNVIWPYNDKTTYVITHNPMEAKENIFFITKDVIENINALHDKNGKDIWLVGGGKLTAMLLNHGLVDEMTLTVIPVILGDGIPLFPNKPKESQWDLVDNISHNNGVIQVVYKKCKTLQLK